ncbi:nuclear transport factor 2 family protein [Actinokineospora guangxiensis]|uniref:Nuclear transport factor 2 family protein n=1 Tax=Actinokineospora guangxiensis TaxID=1490288 RepID=A0ABW0EKV6_9PSEU
MAETHPSITAAGVDHVRLSYLYLDAGDLDGYASLLHEDVHLVLPGSPTGRSRDDAMRLAGERPRPHGTHGLFKVIADGDCVVAVGRYNPASPNDTPGHDFADVFTLSDNALLMSQRRFRCEPPAD